MIVDTPNPSRVALQIVALERDGTPKLDITSGTVRVYHVDAAGAEVVDLAATALVNISSSTWRYNWAPAALAAGQYIARYEITDGTSAFVAEEDLVVRDFALESTLVVTAADIALIRAIEAGTWVMAANQITFYDESMVEVARFNVLDEAGLPSMDDIFQRRRI